MAGLGSLSRYLHPSDSRQALVDRKQLKKNDSIESGREKFLGSTRARPPLSGQLTKVGSSVFNFSKTET